MQCKLQNLTGSLVEQAPDSQDVGSGAVPEGESVADTSDWCSEWSRSPQNSWNEEEKSNQKHDTCGAGEQDEREQQDGRAVEQKGGDEDTCDCDSETQYPVEQGGRVQGDDRHWTTGCEQYRCGSTG